MKKFMLIRSYSGATECWEYIDDLEEAMSYWYVRQAIEKYGVESMMPIVMNKLGGYHTHRPDADDVIKIIEAPDWPDLKVWEMYPMNSDKFRTGWIAPNGDTFMCDVYDHVDCAQALATQLYGGHTKTICDSFLLKCGWFKCSNRKYTGWMRRMSDAQAKYFLDHNFTSDIDCEELELHRVREDNT